MSETEQKQRHEFQSEARQVLELMINSVYSNPDIFLRELISNASDALDKRRVEGLSRPELTEDQGEPSIRVTADAASRVVRVRDNGIGMSRDELISYLGTVARSGTKEFMKAVEAARGADLIGRFGVGFYSSFIAADRVVVRTRRAGETDAWLWESDGGGEFTIEPCDFDGTGTEIELHIKEEDTSDDAPKRDYLSEWSLRSIIKKYSDFVSYPIYLDAGGEGEDKSKPVNSMKAIWTRPEAEVSDEEYKEFYRHVGHDWDDPLERIVYRAEGTSEFHALLYIPAHPPVDLYFPDGARGVELYIKRVFIMSGCKELVPDYLRFVRGVVDSEDLPLNISREILQQDSRTEAIKRGLTRKVLDSLRRARDERPDDYKKIWASFGRVIKEGIGSDTRNREAIMKLCLFETSERSGVTLEQYTANMKEGQKAIYYLAGGTAETLAASPKLEIFRKRGIEVILMSDTVDEFWIGAARKFGEHEFVSAATDGIDLPGGEEPGEDASKLESTGLAARLKEAASALAGGEHPLSVAGTIDEVRVSRRLVDSPAAFVQKDAALTPQMKAMFRAMGQELPPEHRVLELNPSHPLIKRAAADEGNAESWAVILIGLAQAADGEAVEAPGEFSRRLASLLA